LCFHGNYSHLTIFHSWSAPSRFSYASIPLNRSRFPFVMDSGVPGIHFVDVLRIK
uniref:Ovule protein n=1 Tax=Haemonchus placei TaxID=6290 RepID=A0A0N4WWC0_HAEPC